MQNSMLVHETLLHTATLQAEHPPGAHSDKHLPLLAQCRQASRDVAMYVQQCPAMTQSTKPLLAHIC